jgi:hypothetical protein
MTKTLNQIIFFFLHQNQNIFFSNIGNQNIFFRKKTITPPFKLNGRSLIRVIARKLSGSVGHPLFLKIGFMTPQVQFSGIIPVFSTMLNKF